MVYFIEVSYMIKCDRCASRPDFLSLCCGGGNVVIILHAVIMRQLTSHPYKPGRSTAPAAGGEGDHR